MIALALDRVWYSKMSVISSHTPMEAANVAEHS